MATYYLDASAFAKHYLTEPGSHWINYLLAQPAADRFASAEVVSVEVVCALARARRQDRISSGMRDRLIARLFADVKQILRPVVATSPILDEASQLALRYPLRAYDAVHLATALKLVSDSRRIGLMPPVFISADGALLAAARSEGLTAENPDDHP